MTDVIYLNPHPAPGRLLDRGPRYDRWFVVDGNGDTLSRMPFVGMVPDTRVSVCFDCEADAVALRDLLEKGGMKGLTVRRNEYGE